jgi:hypothetical protein
MENTLTIGQKFVTTKSGVEGLIKEINPNNNGTVRILLDVNGSDRWTTA